MRELCGHYVDVQGCRTYYEECGSGPMLLCLAPAGRETTHWHACMQHFADRYHAVAVDLPGHGKSGWHPNGKYLYTVADIAAFLRTFWRRLGAERVAVMGCSLGANMCYVLASMFPDEVAGIVPLQGSDYSPVIAPAALEFLTHPHVNLVPHLVDNALGLTGRSCDPAGRQYIEDSVANVNPEALRADLTAYGHTDIRHQTERIVCPVLAIRGTDDWMVSDELVDGVVSRLTRAAHVAKHHIAGIGHFPHLEAPEAVFRLVDPFLNRFYPANQATSPNPAEASP